jgi:hypothetical protein
LCKKFTGCSQKQVTQVADHACIQCTSMSLLCWHVACSELCSTLQKLLAGWYKAPMFGFFSWVSAYMVQVVTCPV